MTGSRLAALLDQATPGPWDAIGTQVSRPEVDIVEWAYADFPYDEMSVAQARNNARLIALAPDMARLLVDMAEHMKWLRNWVSTDLDTPKTDALLARFAALDEKAGAA